MSPDARRHPSRLARFRTTLARTGRRPRQRLPPGTRPAPAPRRAPSQPDPALTPLERLLIGLLVVVTVVAGLATLAQWLHLA